LNYCCGGGGGRVDCLSFTVYSQHINGRLCFFAFFTARFVEAPALRVANWCLEWWQLNGGEARTLLSPTFDAPKTSIKPCSAAAAAAAAP
jgi:hypothetical protein